MAALDAIPGQIADVTKDLDEAKADAASIPANVPSGSGGTTTNPEATAAAAVIAGIQQKIDDLKNSPLPPELDSQKEKLGGLLALPPSTSPSTDFLGWQENITKGTIESFRMGGLGKEG